jgi:hypothetical protein
VVSISASGSARQAARLRVSGLIDGIIFASTGGVGHSLLRTSHAEPPTAVEAISRQGAVTTITRRAL